MNKDVLIKQVRDTFAMTTKSLDQLGRTGAFHHIIRRQVAMTDTDLYTMEDNREISDLPLTSQGVFGEKLETTLTSNKEKKKTLDELLPNFDSRDRKGKNDTESETNVKKTCREKEKNYNSNSSFRIPKLPRRDDDRRSNYNNNYKSKSNNYQPQQKRSYEGKYKNNNSKGYLKKQQ